jgi:hypothetical protein
MLYKTFRKKMTVALGDHLEIDGKVNINSTNGGYLYVDGSLIAASEFTFFDGVTAGAATASKALVLGTSKQATGIGALTLGAFSSATAGSGVALSASVTKVLAVYADDAGAAMTGSVRTILGRTLLTVDHPGDMSPRGVMGQLKLKDGVDLTNGVASGVEGYLELGGTNNFAATSFAAGVSGVVELATASTITAGGHLAGIASVYTSTATPSGTCSAFITKIGSTAAWPYGIYMPDGTVTNAMYIGNVTTGINFAGTVGQGLTNYAFACGTVGSTKSVTPTDSVIPMQVSITSIADHGTAGDANLPRSWFAPPLARISLMPMACSRTCLLRPAWKRQTPTPTLPLRLPRLRSLVLTR